MFHTETDDAKAEMLARKRTACITQKQLGEAGAGGGVGGREGEGKEQ